MPRWAGVIGAGPMGVWLARHLRKLGYRVILYDLKSDLARREANRIGCLWAKSMDQLGENIQLVLVAVGSENAASTILQLSGILQPHANIIDISSVKSPVVQGLRSLSRRDLVIALSHPLFGPGASFVKGKTIVFTPFRDKRRELNLLRRFFRDARLLTLGYREHDLLMAHCMAVPRLATLSLMMIWVGMKSLDLTTSQKAFTLAASTMLTESPKLFTEIIKLNPYTGEALDEFLEKVNDLSAQDREKLEAHLKRLTTRIPRIRELYGMAYGLLDG